MSDKYFSTLNYSMANEDTGMEFELVKEFMPSKILSVCGSGGRAFPLLTKTTKSITLVDLADEQLMLAKLREHLITHISNIDFKKFFGYAPYSQNENKELRKSILENINLDKKTYDFCIEIHKRNNWNSILYTGSWESTFSKFSKLAKLILGRHSEIMFNFNNLEEQVEYFNKDFPWWRWNIILMIIGNKSLFNAILYKGSFVKKNIKESHLEFYKKSFKSLFYNDLTNKSFFLQLCFLGEIKIEIGNTIEAKENCFLLMKDVIASDLVINYKQKDLIKAIKDEFELDFISMSDVPSYFEGDIEESFLQDIKPNLKNGAIIIIRSYLRVPNVDRSGYLDISDKYQSLIDLEKVQMYNIEILRYINE